MSWTAILLIGWPLASLVGGPVIGRLVAQHMDVTPSEPNPPALPVKAAPSGYDDPLATLNL